jgi:hypothetical protein
MTVGDADSRLGLPPMELIEDARLRAVDLFEAGLLCNSTESRRVRLSFDSGVETLLLFESRCHSKWKSYSMKDLPGGVFSGTGGLKDKVQY